MVLIRLMDCGDFDNSEELIEHLRRNNYQVNSVHIVPFIDIEVSEDECYEVETILRDNHVYYRVFN